MNKLLFLSLCLLAAISCIDQPQSQPTSQSGNPLVAAETTSNLSHEAANENFTPSEPPYEGRSIDQIFPVIESHDFTEEDFNDKAFSVKVEGFEVKFKDFAPLTIDKDGKTVFRFKTRTPGDYHSSLVGVSQLRGKDSKEIYVMAGGPGGVCCTNYWITDISSETPGNIFRSEDFGAFRDWMEIFDANGDGIYELVQWDSAFRYFMDDCGSCSPEPRGVFKFNSRAGSYFPAKGLRQDFLEPFAERDKRFTEEFEKIKRGDPSLENQFYRDLNAHIINLLYFGDDKKAWEIFDKYYSGLMKKKTRAAINERLKDSKFYQALKRSN